jgi:hypothetical protein
MFWNSLPREKRDKLMNPGKAEEAQSISDRIDDWFRCFRAPKISDYECLSTK